MSADPPLIDDFRPQSLVRPASVSELGDLVRRAAADNLGLYPFGGGTMLHFGLPPTKPGIAVDMTALNQVIDYPARDMTITVQAGITMAKLQEILAKENQRLPVDVPFPDKATLGGAIAVNASGPRRYGYGTLRDYVIGISFMNDAGQEVKAGGRVVKNVAGYDLCKLHIGALGTLGMVTQVTLKVKPRPECVRGLSASLSSVFFESVFPRLLASQTRPAAIDLSWFPRHAIDKTGLVTVLFEDTIEAADWQVQQLQRELPNVFRPVSESEILNEITAARDATFLTSALIHNSPRLVPPELSFKASVPPSLLDGLLRRTCPDSANVTMFAQIGNGVVYGHWFDDMTLEDAGRKLTELRQWTVPTQGNLIITRCPPAWKRELKVWGEPRGDLALMRAVKRELDPRDLFNPGRFLV